MDIEIDAEAKDKRLNRLVALTVVVLSIFMGLAQVKDGNIVQNMQQAQSNAVDRWGEYQATKTKLHIDEVALAQSQFMAGLGGAKVAEATATEQARLTKEMAKYQKEVPELRKQAEDFQNQYDGFNVHDDQFDASDALIGTAVAISAVAALTESFPALIAAWVFGAGGLFMGLAGFLGLAIKSPLASLLS
jgi:hypothetical protein